MSGVTEEVRRWRTPSGGIGVYTRYLEGAVLVGVAGHVPPDPDHADHVSEADVVNLLTVMAQEHVDSWNAKQQKIIEISQQNADRRSMERQTLLDDGTSPIIVDKLLPELYPDTAVALSSQEKREIVAGWVQMYQLSPESASMLLEVFGVE